MHIETHSIWTNAFQSSVYCKAYNNQKGVMYKQIGQRNSRELRNKLTKSTICFCFCLKRVNHPKEGQCF